MSQAPKGPSDVVAARALSGKTPRMVVLRHDSLLEAVTCFRVPDFRPGVKIPEAALCGVFQFPLENNCRGRKLSASTPKRPYLHCSGRCQRHQAARRESTLIPTPENQASICSSFGSWFAGRKSENALIVCSGMPARKFERHRNRHPSWAFGRKPIAPYASKAVRIGFHPDDEDAGSCRILPRDRMPTNGTPSGAFRYGNGVWRQTCYIVDHLADANWNWQSKFSRMSKSVGAHGAKA
jgi:hypothetical protein